MSYMQDGVQLIRLLTGDDDSPYTYCEDRLENLFLGSAKMVLSELTFNYDYIVDLGAMTVSPDPVNDPYFIPLVALYAAVKIANSEYKVSALSAITITDGPSNISMGGSATAMKARLDALTKEYQNAKMQYGIGVCPGQQYIISTLESIYSRSYINGSFNPNLYYQYSH